VLTKKICKICVAHGRIAYRFEPFVKFPRLNWDNEDEEIWREGKVICDYGHYPYPEERCRRGKTAYINEMPPPGCPYALEHVMETQKC